MFISSECSQHLECQRYSLEMGEFWCTFRYFWSQVEVDALKKSSCWNFMGLDLENRKDEWIGFRYEIKQFSVPVFWDSLLCGERAVNLFKIYCSSETFQQFLECIFLMQSKSELLLIGQDCLCRASFLAWNLHDYKINLASSPVLNQ